MADAQSENLTEEAIGAPLGGTRAEALQRLQVGLAGIGAMILLVGLANVIQNRAQLSELTSVPDAAPTTEAHDGIFTSVGAVVAGAGAMTKLAAGSTFRLLGEKLLPNVRRGRNRT